MSEVVTIAGSPSYPSRSSAVLDHIRDLLAQQHITSEAINVRSLPFDALFLARIDNPVIQDAINAIAEASAVIIATPVYKAAYTGILKTFLDLLPQNALANKTIYPIATAGAPGHQLAIDYALRPVLSALGAHHILSGLYILDSQIQYANGLQLEDSIEKRLLDGIQALTANLSPIQPELSLSAGK